MAIYIGIDPGEHTGIAVWDTGLKKFLLIQTMPLHRALDEVRKWHASQGATVIFEDARQRQWFQKERNVSEYRGKLMGGSPHRPRHHLLHAETDGPLHEVVAGAVRALHRLQGAHVQPRP